MVKGKTSDNQKLLPVSRNIFPRFVAKNAWNSERYSMTFINKPHEVQVNIFSSSEIESTFFCMSPSTAWYQLLGPKTIRFAASQTLEDGNCQSQKPSKRRQSWRKASASPDRSSRWNVDAVLKHKNNIKQWTANSYWDCWPKVFEVSMSLSLMLMFCLMLMLMLCLMLLLPKLFSFSFQSQIFETQRTQSPRWGHRHRLTKA